MGSSKRVEGLIMSLNHSQRSEIVDRMEKRHEELLERLDTLNLQIMQILGSLTHDRENSSGTELQSNLSAS